MDNMKLQCADLSLDLSSPQVMGVLNTTPDSFSDGGSYYQGGGLDLGLVVERAHKMVEEGATIIDVGGESTRPGAEPVSLDEELRRVVPVVEAIRKSLEVVISVDTSSPPVIKAAAAVGAGVINDVRALQRDGALQAAAETQLPVCLMHMMGEPGTMQNDPRYSDVICSVREFLAERIAACEAAGISRSKLLVDPGFGFGKTIEHNLDMLRNLGAFAELDLPILVGLSRKSMLQHLLGRAVDERLAGSVALALLAAQHGASIIRAHDVAATRDVLTVLRAVEENTANC
ncbi:dihydropteroate synthase [Aurantivibrio plasticivorans]